MTPEFSLGHHEFEGATDLPAKSLIPHDLHQNFIVYDLGKVQPSGEHQGAILVENPYEASDLGVNLPNPTRLIGGIRFIEYEAGILERNGHERKEGIVFRRIEEIDFWLPQQ